MKLKRFVVPILLLFFCTFAYADKHKYTIDDIKKLVPPQTSKGWWHKQVSTMADNRYMSSFQSLDHKGKLGWDVKDISDGKITIVQAMALAKNWSMDNRPFGD